MVWQVVGGKATAFRGAKATNKQKTSLGFAGTRSRSGQADVTASRCGTSRPR
jgi:hypothetical protein